MTRPAWKQWFVESSYVIKTVNGMEVARVRYFRDAPLVAAAPMLLYEAKRLLKEMTEGDFCHRSDVFDLEPLQEAVAEAERLIAEVQGYGGPSDADYRSR